MLFKTVSQGKHRQATTIRVSDDLWLDDLWLDERQSARNLGFSCAPMAEPTGVMFMHMLAVRAVAVRQDNRARRLIDDHPSIVAALERGDADLAERLVREHMLGLAMPTEKLGLAFDGELRRASAKAGLFLQVSATQQSRGARRYQADRHDRVAGIAT